MGMLIQMPVFLGLYSVVSNIANPNLTTWMKFSHSMIEMTYSFLYPYVNTMIDTSNLITNFFGIDILSKNHIGLAIIG
jgi:membrane protein insertase Oxa1/YidC/SpoIIIJ